MDRTWTVVAAMFRGLPVGSAAGAVAGVVWLCGCGGPAAGVGANGTCFHAEDCDPGLVCIEQKCTSDLSSIDIKPADAGSERGSAIVGTGGAAPAGTGGGAGASGASGAGGVAGDDGAAAGTGGASGDPGNQGTPDGEAPGDV